MCRDGIEPPEEGRAEIARLEEKVAQLEGALQSRIVIEQAKGILAERLAISVDEAFDILRYAARSHRTKLRDVATRVIRERETPAPVIVSVARAQRARAAWMREVAEAHRLRAEELSAVLDDRLEKFRDRGEAR